jgi:hypothetical protein
LKNYEQGKSPFPQTYKFAKYFRDIIFPLLTTSQKNGRINLFKNGYIIPLKKVVKP